MKTACFQNNKSQTLKPQLPIYTSLQVFFFDLKSHMIIILDSRLLLYTALHVACNNKLFLAIRCYCHTQHRFIKQPHDPERKYNSAMIYTHLVANEVSNKE